MCTHSHVFSNTSGFFYFHREPNAPLLAAEIRFRLTDSSDPASFASGSDLLSNGLPWLLPIFSLLKHDLVPLADILVRDGLLSDEFIRQGKDVKTGKSGNPFKMQKAQFRSPPIYSFGQPFFVDLRFRSPTYRFVSEGSINAQIMTYNLLNFTHLKSPVKGAVKAAQSHHISLPLTDSLQAKCSAPLRNPHSKNTRENVWS